MAELESLLARADERRRQLHHVHERTVDKLDTVNRMIQDLRRDLNSLRSDRQTNRVQATERKVQDLTRELDSLRDVRKTDKLSVRVQGLGSDA